MLLTPVNSAAIAAVGYDGYYLYVLFHTSDAVYAHPGVPNAVYIELLQADSMGAYYNRHIRGRYK